MAGDTNFFAVCRLRTGRVDGGSADSNFFLTVTWCELRRVYSGTTDSDFLTIAGLDSRSIFAFSNVNVSTVLSTTRSFDVNFVCGVVFSTTVGNVNVNVCR